MWPHFLRVRGGVLATLVLGGVIGVIEVTLAHALTADESRAPAAHATVSREGP